MLIWRKLVSDPLLRMAKKRVPPMSDTEREAIEAGTVGWDADLFSGKPDWNKLLSFPSPTLSPREQAFLASPLLSSNNPIHGDKDIFSTSGSIHKRDA